MLHRAARHACSWWWASHLRTKQSKWLDQIVQDMEEKVAYMLKIIDEDGDTFRQRAEMYYRKRPELVSFVEDAFREYRALAERYDLLSKQLQSAIAAIYPEKIPFVVDDFDVEKDHPGLVTGFNNNKLLQVTKNPPPPAPPKINIPKTANVLSKNPNEPSSFMSKKGLLKKKKKKVVVNPDADADADHVPASVVCSGLNKSHALERIDKLQKEILTLQTEKEFLRSSYESRVEKYWLIEEQITEMQREVEDLQDEFRIEMDIGNGEARTLMTTSAMKTCQKTLAYLQNEQKQASEDARIEFQKVQEAREKFERLKQQLNYKQDDQDHLDLVKKNSDQTELEQQEEEGSAAEEAIPDRETLHRKIKDDFIAAGSGNSLTISDLAEQVDELAEKVINLENVVTSQNAYVKRLRSETNELQGHIKSLEGEKEILLDDSSSKSHKIKELEQELQRVHSLNQCIKERDNNLQTQLVEASCNLDDLTEKLQHVEPDEEEENVTPEKLFQLQEAKETRMNVTQDFKDLNNDAEEKAQDPEKNTRNIEEQENLTQTTSSYPHNDKQMITSSDTTRELAAQQGMMMTTTATPDQSLEVDIWNNSMSEMDNETNPFLSTQLVNMNDFSTSPTRTTLECSSFGWERDLIPSNNGKDLVYEQEKHTSEAGSSNDSFQFCPPINGNQNDIYSSEGDILDVNSEIFGVHASSISAEQSVHDGSERKSDQRGIDKKTGTEEEHINLNPGNSNGSSSEKSNIQPNHDPLLTTQMRSTSEKNQHEDGFNKNVSVNPDIKWISKQNSLTDQVNDEEAKRQNLLQINTSNDNENEEVREEEDQSNWRGLFECGIDDKEKILLNEYKSVLRNYKETRKKLSAVEVKNRASQFHFCIQMTVLKNAVAEKESEIQLLREQLNFVQADHHQTEKKTLLPLTVEVESTEEEGGGKTEAMSSHVSNDHQPVTGDEKEKGHKDLLSEEENSESKYEAAKEETVIDQVSVSFVDVNKIASEVEDTGTLSIIEKKIRADIDELQEENIELWMRFSSKFNEIQKYQAAVKDLQEEIGKLKGKNQKGGNTDHHIQSLSSDIRPIYRHLTEIQTEVILWLDHNSVINDDFENRSSSLSSIHEEIVRLSSSTTKSKKEEQVTTVLDEYQAAKFQGELLNMKRENSKVAEELKLGLEKGKNLQVEIEKTLKQLDDEFEVSVKRNQSKYAGIRTRIPLKTFLFGAKLKKQKRPSFFACIGPSMQKQQNDVT